MRVATKMSLLTELGNHGSVVACYKGAAPDGAGESRLGAGFYKDAAPDGAPECPLGAAFYKDIAPDGAGESRFLRR